jgi:uncharacterized DUF497 family protein
MIFASDDWNERHIAEHDVTREEAEAVVRRARGPFPREVGNDKHLVWGTIPSGRLLQVIFSYRTESEIDLESVQTKDLIELTKREPIIVYVVHARDLTSNERRRYRRLKNR